MGVNSLPKTVTRQRRGCDLNPDPSALESSTLTTRLLSHHCKCTSEHMLADRQTDRQTDTHRHAYHDTQLPYWGRSNNSLTADTKWQPGRNIGW